ncbi:MAG: hypothetical protein OXG58_10085 [Gemmatimonadetes bacterium]|nr:hypothetical protein [Gemmatimonadota bacterium]MCY3943806.1 hypothetical protein [Gemmatimonadota bacterium]
MAESAPSPSDGTPAVALGEALTVDVGRLMSDRLGLSQSDLITRPTGRAVREAIEACTAGASGGTVALVELSGVRVMDFSCADEVVAGLLLRSRDSSRSVLRYFIFRGCEHLHGHAVAEVLSRRGLAAACAFGGRPFHLVGEVSDGQRAAWLALEERRRIALGEATTLLGPGGRARLVEICEMRLAHMNSGGQVRALSRIGRGGGDGAARIA